MLRTSTLKTSHADISVTETSGTGLPVLLIHGNSSCKEVFANQLENEMGETYRMIALDLPGHGASGDAHNPSETYTMKGYAQVVLEVLNAMGVTQAVVFGWSLGGHIAIELLPQFQGLAGLMISGAPPVQPTAEGMQAGFKAHPMVGLIGKSELTDEEVAIFSDGAYGPAATPGFDAALRRTDGRARATMFEGLFNGKTSDQRDLVVSSKVPVAVVNGENDPIINTDYVGGLEYASLWDKHCFVFRGEGHAPFLTNPEVFNPIFDRFLMEMAELSERRPPRTGAEAAA